MLLDKSYFIGPLTIAQLGDKSVNDNLTVFINRFEPEVLQAALGYDLSLAFLEGLDVGSDEEIEQKWIDLRDGILFITPSGIKKKWPGFANDETKASAISGFIYAEVESDNATQNTGSGMVKNQGENSTPVNPAYKICQAWNESCRNMQILWDFLRTVESVGTYTEYSYQQIDTNYFKPKNPFGI